MRVHSLIHRQVEAKTNALTELSGKLAERVYAQKAETEGAPSETAADATQESTAADGDVVDAEFEEVKDDDKK